MAGIIGGVDHIYDHRAIKVFIAKVIADGPHGTQARLARHLQAPVPTINKWAQRLNCPGPKHWPAIEEFFGMEPGTIAGVGGVALSTLSDVETVILAAKELTEDQRDALLRVYHAFSSEAVAAGPGQQQHR